MTSGFPAPNGPLVQQVFAGWQQDTGPVTSAADVAKAVWRAVTDEGAPAHIPAGADAIAWSRGA